MSNDLRLRRDQVEGSTIDIIAAHIKKEAYLHRRLSSEISLRRTITKKLLEDNSDIKTKSRRVIELLTDKLRRAEFNADVYSRRMTALEDRLLASNNTQEAYDEAIAINGEVDRTDIDKQHLKVDACPHVFKSPVASRSPGSSLPLTRIFKSESTITTKQSNLIESSVSHLDYEWQERDIIATEEELQSISAAKRKISKLTAVINDLSHRRTQTSLVMEQRQDDERLDLTDRIRELDTYDLVVSDGSPTKGKNMTNISSQMENDIADIAVGMELTQYKSMVEDLTVEIETIKEESKVRAMQSIERIKQLKDKLSIISQARDEADRRIASLEHELNEKSRDLERCRDTMHTYESELEEVRSAATTHHSEIGRLKEQMQRERSQFIKLRKSLSRLDSLQTSVFSAQSSTVHNLPTDQIKEIYHLGRELTQCQHRSIDYILLFLSTD